MTVRELRDYILTQMSAEDALLKLLESPMIQYEKLKFDKGKEVHPLIILANAAMDMGWNFVVDKQENVEGLIVGTKEYIDRLMGTLSTKKNNPN